MTAMTIECPHCKDLVAVSCEVSTVPDFLNTLSEITDVKMYNYSGNQRCKNGHIVQVTLTVTGGPDG